MALFKEQLHTLPKPVNILDVGGAEAFWVNTGLHDTQDIHITILNLTKATTHYKNISAVKGDATDLSAYKDDAFDIVFSNSVIEHLYTKDNQKSMAKEVTRVGKYHYVRTPNKYFVIEPHYLLPFFQFLPKKIRYFILTKTKLSRFRKWTDQAAEQYIKEIVLLSKKDIQELFPSSKIWKERFAGMTKSFVAHNFK